MPLVDMLVRPEDFAALTEPEREARAAHIYRFGSSVFTVPQGEPPESLRRARCLDRGWRKRKQRSEEEL